MAMVNIPVEPPVTDFLFRKAAHFGVPLSATMELTPVCNMACRMCYVRMTKKEQEAIHPLYSKEDWIALGQTLRDQGILYLLLTGGEPFLREDFRDILAALHKMGFLISINSNGTLIDEKVIEWLKETPPLRINMTLYGASDETYERLCCNPKGFTQVKKAIHLLKEAGIVVKLNCSLTPYNAADLEGMIAFAREEQLIIQPTSYMFPPLRRDQSSIGKNDRFTAEEAAYWGARIESLLNGEERFLERMENMDFPAIPTDSEECMDVEGDVIRCRAGRCSLWITWHGTLLPCGMMPSEGMKNVFEAGFDEAWSAARSFVKEIRLPAKCTECTLRDQCKACAAMTFTETGTFDTVPEYRCQMSKHYEAACRQVEKEIRERLNAPEIES